MYRKVAAGGIAGAVTTVIVWALSEFGVEMPPEVAAALTTLLAVGAGYVKREPAPAYKPKPLDGEGNMVSVEGELIK